jgi:hypothetical protein
VPWFANRMRDHGLGSILVLTIALIMATCHGNSIQYRYDGIVEVKVGWRSCV